MKTKIKLPSAKKVASYAKKAWKSDAGNKVRKVVMNEANKYIKASKPYITTGLSVAGGMAGEAIGGPAGGIAGGELGTHVGNLLYKKAERAGQRQEDKIDRRLKR